MIESCWRCGTLTTVVNGRCEKCNLDLSEEEKQGTLASVAEQRNAWRAACRYLYEVIGEGGSKGRPLDLIAKGDYGRIIAMIGKAESMEEGSGVCHCGLPMDAHTVSDGHDPVEM